MTTTIVRDSLVGDEWIQQTAAAVPVQRVVDPTTGQPTGDILTGPVRLGWNDLFTLPKPMANKQGGSSSEPKYGTKILFTPLADLTILQEVYMEECQKHWMDHFDAGTNQFLGLHSPFRDQAEKVKAGSSNGYTPGCVFLTSTSKYKPSITDARRNPIVDTSRVYAGVWAICAVRPYAYGRNFPKFGIGFGIQSVMIIGDDKQLGGGQAADPNKMFGGINVTAPIVRPDMAAQMGGQAAAGVPGYMPPAVPQGQQAAAPVAQTTWTGVPPGGGAAPVAIAPLALAAGSAPNAGVNPAAIPPAPMPGCAPSVPLTTRSPSDEEEMRAMGLL